MRLHNKSILNKPFTLVQPQCIQVIQGLLLENLLHLLG